MENNALKNLWETTVDKHVRQYSENELNVMVVKSTQKSMCKLHPRWTIVSCIIIAGYLLWAIIYNTGNIRFTMFYAFLLLLIF